MGLFYIVTETIQGENIKWVCELNDQFKENLDLLTESGKYNYAAYMLADNNGVSIKVAKYAETDKVDLIENEEYGYCSIIKAVNKVLDKFIVVKCHLSLKFIPIDLP